MFVSTPKCAFITFLKGNECYLPFWWSNSPDGLCHNIFHGSQYFQRVAANEKASSTSEYTLDHTLNVTLLIILSHINDVYLPM